MTCWTFDPGKAEFLVRRLVSRATLSSIGIRKDMLAVWTTRIVTISSSGISNSLIFGSSLFLSPLFIFRASPTCVLAWISGRTRRARLSLWSSRTWRLGPSTAS
jgi:hypothetical protein